MSHNIPWMLELFYEDEFDLAEELAGRYGNLPVMSSIKFRSLGAQSRRGVAVLATQDGAARSTFEVMEASCAVQLSFTFGSMLTLRFMLQDLNHNVCTRWIDQVRGGQENAAFLWGPSRCEQDYLISVSYKYFVNLYAFSANNFEAAVRLTPEVMGKLLDWLEQYWGRLQPEDDNPLMTW